MVLPSTMSFLPFYLLVSLRLENRTDHKQKSENPGPVVTVKNIPTLNVKSLRWMDTPRPSLKRLLFLNDLSVFFLYFSFGSQKSLHKRRTTNLSTLSVTERSF